jgi:hypothetical protein
MAVGLANDPKAMSAVQGAHRVPLETLQPRLELPQIGLPQGVSQYCRTTAVPTVGTRDVELTELQVRRRQWSDTVPTGTPE